MDLLDSVSHGHAGSRVPVSLKNLRLIWCGECALVIPACLRGVVETLTTARGGQSCPTSLSVFAALAVLLGRSRGSPKRLRFPQGMVEVVAVPRLHLVMSLLIELQGFPIAFSFFRCYSSSCCPGSVEADLQSHLSHLLFQSMLP